MNGNISRFLMGAFLIGVLMLVGFASHAAQADFEDTDGDGVVDVVDNCPFDVNPDQTDNDGDGFGNVCDPTPNGSGYIFNGVLQPVNGDGSSIFKLGSTVPVKFQLTDASGVSVTTAAANLYVSKVSDGVAGSEVEAISTSSATSGSLFRYDSTSDQYVFNLGTKGLSSGTWQLRIALDDGTSHFVNISLK